MTPKILWSVALLILSAASYAQDNGLYTYQDLSHIHYARAKDSLRRTWTCPSLFKDKTTQKKYKEIWDGRTEMITIGRARGLGRARLGWKLAQEPFISFGGISPLIESFVNFSRFEQRRGLPAR